MINEYEAAMTTGMPVRNEAGIFQTEKAFAICVEPFKELPYDMHAVRGEMQHLTYVEEAIWVPEIEQRVRAAMMESAAALSLKYGKPLPELEAHVEYLINRYTDGIIAHQLRNQEEHYGI